MKHLFLALCLSAAVLHGADEPKKSGPLTAKAAKAKVGETVTVEDKVAEVNKTDRIIRLNLGAKFPKQELTLVIFPDNFAKFEDVEKLADKTVRASGRITEYQGRPQIVLTDKGQLQAVEPTGSKK
jgi:hypothetical protein